MKDIVKTNIYRCLEHCPNCPFLDNGKAVNLAEGGVDEIKKMLLASDNNSFNCHKTVYNLDNNMHGTEEQTPKMCYGAYLYLKKNGQSNIQMRLAEHFGIDSE